MAGGDPSCSAATIIEGVLSEKRLAQVRAVAVDPKRIDCTEPNAVSLTERERPIVTNERGSD